MEATSPPAKHLYDSLSLAQHAPAPSDVIQLASVPMVQVTPLAASAYEYQVGTSAILMNLVRS